MPATRHVPLPPSGSSQSPPVVPATAAGLVSEAGTTGVAELDQFDYVEDLTILGGTNVEVFNAVSLHGGLAGSWPMSRMSAENTVQKLIAFWKHYGCPDFAQFDNSTVFQGPRHADSLGRVIRLCLSLGVTPVFAPPGETGFQAAIESYNGRWQRGVWKRFHFEDIPAVCRQSDLYVAAVNEKNWERFAASPSVGKSPTTGSWITRSNCVAR